MYRIMPDGKYMGDIVVTHLTVDYKVTEDALVPLGSTAPNSRVIQPGICPQSDLKE